MRITMRIARRLAALTGAVVLLGCEGGPFSLQDSLAMARAEQRWTTVATPDYSFTLRESCFCQYTGPFRVTVRADTVESIEWLGEPVPRGYERYLPRLTIPELFAFARSQSRGEGVMLLIKYDPALGYPREITTWTSNPDSGLSYFASDVVFEAP